jgi:hypothetical protein
VKQISLFRKRLPDSVTAQRLMPRPHTLFGDQNPVRCANNKRSLYFARHLALQLHRPQVIARSEASKVSCSTKGRLVLTPNMGLCKVELHKAHLLACLNLAGIYRESIRRLFRADLYAAFMPVRSVLFGKCPRHSQPTSNSAQRVLVLCK